MAGVPFVETVVVAVEPSHILVLAGGKALRILEVDLRLGGPCLEQPPDPQPRLVPPPEKLLCVRVLRVIFSSPGVPLTECSVQERTHQCCVSGSARVTHSRSMALCSVFASQPRTLSLSTLPSQMFLIS